MSKVFDNVRDAFDGLPMWGKFVVGSAAIGVSYVVIRVVSGGKSRKSPLKDDWKKDVVYLYQFGRVCPAIPQLSPYCFKVETYLRMKQLKYENVPCSLATRSKAGQLPFIELNGEEYYDSTLIIQHLEKVFGLEETSLSAADRATAHGFLRMLDNSTSWSFTLSNYVHHAKEFFSEKIFGDTLTPMMKIWWTFAAFYQKLFGASARVRMYHHGIGRHPDETIIDIGLRDLRALSDFLAGKPFMFGAEPTSFDAALYSWVSRILDLPIATDHQVYINNNCHNLVEYNKRMRDRFWKDFDTIRKDEPVFM